MMLLCYFLWCLDLKLAEVVLPKVNRPALFIGHMLENSGEAERLLLEVNSK